MALLAPSLWLHVLALGGRITYLEMRSAVSSHVRPFAHTIPRFGTLGVLGHVGAVPGTPRVSERISAFRDTRCFGTDFGVSGHLVFWNGFRRFGTPRRPEDTSRRPGDAGCPRDASRRPGDAPGVSRNTFWRFGTPGVPKRVFVFWDGSGCSRDGFLRFGTAEGGLGRGAAVLVRRDPCRDADFRSGPPGVPGRLPAVLGRPGGVPKRDFVFWDGVGRPGVARGGNRQDLLERRDGVMTASRRAARAAAAAFYSSSV